MEKEREPRKRAYSRPQLVKFGRADRLTEGIIRPLPSGLRDILDT